MGHVDNSHGVENHFIGYMKCGKALISSQDIKLELNAGDLFYIPKGLKYHSYWKTGEEPARFDSIGFHYFPTQDSSEFILQKIPHDEDVMKAFMPLSNDKTISCASIGSLYTLLGLLENNMMRSENCGEEKNIGKLVRLMKENTNKAIGEYAADLGISEAALYIRVKKHFGKTPNTLRQEIKCQKAAELLCTTNFSVEEICDKCGFSSASYFRKVLREITGKTPSQIRKSNRTV